MKILFAIQGTGNGHISRAREVLPHLKNYGEVDLLVSGTQADVSLDQPLDYRFHGFSFIFGKKGGVDHWKTYQIMNLPQLYRDVKQLPVKDYDLVINDFEPVSAWACRMQHKPCIALSHQASFLSKHTPRSGSGFNWAEWIFRYYAPSTHQIGFHFQAYDDFIHTPVIRSEIRQLEPADLGHITVYLPAFADQTLLRFFKQVPEIEWKIFSKHSSIAYQEANVAVQPIHHENFNASLARAHGLLTGGGFEGPAEALFLGKKVAVIPMKNQYEQQCNAEAASRMGVLVLHRLDDQFVPKIRQWLSNASPIRVNFPDETAPIIANLINRYGKLS